MKIGLGLGISQLRASGGGAPPGPTLAALPVTPTARWHPGFSTVVESGGRVVSATDLQGLADVTEGAAGAGAFVMTDALGRKFWRFEGAEYLNIATALAATRRNSSAFLVMRAHFSEAKTYLALGNLAAGTQQTGGGIFDVNTATSRAPFLRGYGNDTAGLDATNRRYMIPGQQLQVLGVASRTTALGGLRLMVDGNTSLTARVADVSFTGGEVGRNPSSAGTSGNWARMDVYEIVIYNTGLSNTDAAAVQATLQAHYGIADKTSQIVLDGDSITQTSNGFPNPGESTGMQLTHPGMMLVPDNYRVINVAVLGQVIANLVTRRDAVNGWPDQTLAGNNTLIFEIGRNSLNSAGSNVAHRTAMVNYLNTASTGVLQRGWNVRQLINIATLSGTAQGEIVAQRANIRDPSYLTDTLSGPGQAYDGKLTRVDTDLIEDGGQTIFLNGADAADTVYYGDGIHLTNYACRLRASGGDTPSRGMANGLT